MVKYNAENDDRVFVFVRPIDDPAFEKRSNTKGIERYGHIKRGMTVQEFLALPLPNNRPRHEDVKWNEVPRPSQRTANLVLAEPKSPEALEARSDYLKQAVGCNALRIAPS